MLNAVAVPSTAIPEVALFASWAIGHGVGKTGSGPAACVACAARRRSGKRARRSSLSPHPKTVFLALFIFAPGFAGGPQSFSNLNARRMRLGAMHAPSPLASGNDGSTFSLY
jgi:hypothetical protein